MKRHPRLITLSQEHHHALKLALDLLQGRADAGAVLIQRDELLHHFDDEEREFAPYWAQLSQRPETAHLEAQFVHEHRLLREDLADAPELADAQAFARRLQAHVRFEERELFPALERCFENNDEAQ